MNTWLPLAWFTLGMGLLQQPTGSIPNRSGVSPPNAPAASPKRPPLEPIPSEENSQKRLSAEEVLRAIKHQRPESTIIAPASAAGRRFDVPPPTLLPEGYPVVSRRGSLVREGQQWAIRFTDAPDLPAMKILPNIILEPLARMVSGADQAQHFEVSGETTVFQNENYLLIRFALHSREEIHASSTAAQSGSPQGQNVSSLPDKPTTSADASVEDVFKALRAEGPAKNLVSMVAVSPAFAPNDGTSFAATLLPDGANVVERPGRLVRQGETWALAFESNHPDRPEPSLRVLPNKSLESMLSAMQRGGDGLVFVVSGEVTAYNGENHLLVRNARRRLDSGNLRK